MNRTELNVEQMNMVNAGYSPFDLVLMAKKAANTEVESLKKRKEQILNPLRIIAPITLAEGAAL